MKHNVMLMTIVLFAVGALLAPQQTLAQVDAGVTPNVGPPGIMFAFYATGFEGGDEDTAKEEVSVWLNRPDGSVTTEGIEQVNNITSSGRADWIWDAPDDAQAGVWSAVARGNDSQHEVVIPFEISYTAEAPAPVPTGGESNVQPNAGPGGTTFAFYATGFDADEEIGVWLNTPGGDAIDADVDELNNATGTGRADWLWTAPTDAQPGIWQMVARGKDSGVEHVISFELMP